jgi:histidinol dehydrogenase
VAVFITTNSALADRVSVETKRLAADNPIARASIEHNGVIFVTESVTEAQDLTNRLAPEHLTIDEERDIEWVTNAGSVFVGYYSTQPMGDYISGPNHTLPTGGFARVRGGLSVLDFLKLITVQKYQREGIRRLGPAAVTLAEAEGLMAHAKAIRVRGVHG